MDGGVGVDRKGAAEEGGREGEESKHELGLKVFDRSINDHDHLETVVGTKLGSRCVWGRRRPATRRKGGH